MGYEPASNPPAPAAPTERAPERPSRDEIERRARKPSPLKLARRARGLSQYELAKAAGMSPATVCSAERHGLGRVKVSTGIRIIWHLHSLIPLRYEERSALLAEAGLDPNFKIKAEPATQAEAVAP